MANFMTQNGFTDIHRLFVFKPQQNTAGMNWFLAVEQMIVGYKEGIGDCAVTFSQLTPLFGHNLLFGLQVDSKIKHAGEAEEVNTPENPHVASFRAQRLFKSGAGSGSKVVGLAHLGCTWLRWKKTPSSSGC